MLTRQHRKSIAAAVLLISIIAAGYIAIPKDSHLARKLEPERGTSAFWLAGFIDMLNHKELAHVAGHLAIFGGVATLLGPWGRENQRGSIGLAVRYVTVGAILMEAVQVTVGYSDDTIHTLISGVLFDLLLDSIALVLALMLVQRYSQQLTLTAERLRLT